MEDENILETIKEFISKNLIYVFLLLIFIVLVLLFLPNNKKNNEVVVDSKLTLVLNGDKRITLFKGDNYIEKGYYAYDTKDGDITNRVVIDNNLDINKSGEYTIKYSVINSNNKIAEEVRYISVIEKLDNFNISLDYNPKKETKDNVTITLKISGEGLDFILDPDGNVIHENELNYKVKENDEYAFSIKKKDGTVIEKSITISNIEKEEIVTFDIKISELKKYIDSSSYDMLQIATFSNGKIIEKYADGCNDNTTFYLSSGSKAILGIVAAKMHEDNIINLNSLISKYWYNLNSYNFNSCTDDWKSMMGNENTIRDHTSSSRKMVENPATLAHALTHSSTIKNMNMVHMIPGDETSEYFGGSLSSNYGRAAFMLHHSSHQLFEEGGIPGTKTNYNYQSDDLTREHSMAGFTMQIAMKESVNEYMQKTILNKVNASSKPMFKNGNSIYFAAGYLSSATDVAKIVAAVANDGVYENNVIFRKETIDNIEKVYSNLNNQTIAFDYINGKYIKYGNFSNLSYFDKYKLSDMYKNYASYITYNPKTSNGYVITIKYKNQSDKQKALNMFNSISSYFYGNE